MMRKIIALINSCLLILIFSVSVYAQQPVGTLGATEAEELCDSLDVSGGNNGAFSCVEGVMPSGALYRICMPETWKGWLVVYAHGFVKPDEPLQIPREAEFVAPVLSKLGVAFGVTSYRINGFSAAKWGQQDVLDVVDLFSSLYTAPDRVLIAGTSQGGGVATKLAEDHPDIFNGGLGLCSVSNIHIQLNHHYDFRVIFDYFFPGLIPGSAIEIPLEVMDNWDTIYVPAITEALLTKTAATDQLFSVTGVTVNMDDPDMIVDAAISLLENNIFSTNDMIDNMGGNPYSNISRVYEGSDNDSRLNNNVARHAADFKALLEAKRYYTTSGDMTIPFVAMHTTGDYIVPFTQLISYRAKVRRAGFLDNFTPFPVERYGHCYFTPEEVLYGFLGLLKNVGGAQNEMSLP